ncbi:membrane protein [Pullulanibacillus camelliae]|uniref:Membrane protein n=1 Tax=Pullulanibacillus camelliae TaxID=1707096 RepID=A0A8J2YPF8_9BACL|nr:hemolysin family protein [Pullulanibacillus camelliae]GGE56297.1 membrane protein [Pullulanibacillus camelliae]
MSIINLLFILILIIISAYFVAAEFAIVKVRKTKIDQLASDGNKNAKAVQKILTHLDGYLSTTQLGITIVSLIIGWIGEPAIGHLLHPVITALHLPKELGTSLSIIVAFVLITFFHVVLGELAPKSFAIQKAEAISLAIARPLIVFNTIMYPFIWILNQSSMLFAKLLGLSPAAENETAHSEEELRLIVSESYKNGEINSTEMEYVNNVFDFDDRVAKEIMIPRTEIICLFSENTLEENIAILKEEKYTRYPVADTDKDHILGYVNIKDIFTDYLQEKTRPINQYIRPVAIAIENMPVNELLKKMQTNKTHMAIVVDEYGGTAGLVTIEDILEEIVGEIQDEFDIEELPDVRKINGKALRIDGKVLISDINAMFGLDIDDTDIDTIGGWVLSNEVDAQKGTVIPYGDYAFEVTRIEGHQIKEIELKKLNDEAISIMTHRDLSTEKAL